MKFRRLVSFTHLCYLTVDYEVVLVTTTTTTTTTTIYLYPQFIKNNYNKHKISIEYCLPRITIRAKKKWADIIYIIKL